MKKTSLSAQCIHKRNGACSGHNTNTRQKNLSEIRQLSIDYPRHNVGIVGRRGVGNLAFLDIDSEGMLERIETETGQKLPSTYTVQSRPESAPWKRHMYFRHKK